MTLLVPLFMIGIFSVQYFVQSLSGEQRSDLIVISDSDEILNKVQNEIFQTGPFKSGDLTTRFEKLNWQISNPNSMNLSPIYWSKELLELFLFHQHYYNQKELSTTHQIRIIPPCFIRSNPQ